jgi:pyruvate formate lyase activating enzyme
MLGQELSVEEVFHEVKKDELYYRNSKGGVTASGGEPLSQAEFVSALFKRCQNAGIHTTLDTCGAAKRSALEQVLEHTDLVLFDLKVIDRETHIAIMSNSNKSILDNAKFIIEKEIPLIVRIPLIPDLTEAEENIRAMARFVTELGDGVSAVNILPYHRFGMSKYKMLDREYELEELKPPPEERVKAVVEVFEALRLPCEVVT